MPTLFVDADACPVKAEAVAVAGRFGWPVAMVCNGGIRPFQEPHVRMVVVGDALDAADDWIAAEIGAGDVCVTSDIPLSARVIEAGGRVLQPDGSVLDARNIGGVLATRNLMADLRSAAPLAAGGGGRAFGKADRSRFRERLDALLRAAGAPR